MKEREGEFCLVPPRRTMFSGCKLQNNVHIVLTDILQLSHSHKQPLISQRLCHPNHMTSASLTDAQVFLKRMRGVLKGLGVGIFLRPITKGHKLTQDFQSFFYQKGRIEDKVKRQQRVLGGSGRITWTR